MTLKLKLAAAALFICQYAVSQVVVDGKDINQELELQYIQLMYYIDKKDFKPVYMIDYGIKEEPGKSFTNQKIKVRETDVTSALSPVYVLNQLYKAGWEYLGDAAYVRAPMQENWYSYTLKRKAGIESAGK